MHNNKSIVFTGSFTYPLGFAATKRIQNIVNSAQKRNYKTFIILNSNNLNPREGYHSNTRFLTTCNKSTVNVIAMFKYPLIIKNWFLELKNIKNKSSNNYLYVYSGITIENFIQIKIAKKLGYRIIVDIVEDYQLHQEKVTNIRRFKILSMGYFEKHIVGYADALVVISNYLLDKFNRIAKKEIPIYKYPIVASINSNAKVKKENDKVRIVYSGTYGHKDGIPILIEAIHDLQINGYKILLELTGKLNNNIRDSLNKKNIHFFDYGFLSDEELYIVLKNADILVAPRIDSKYANAGFPFKLGEYLATGNPVVTTKVSDIETYISDKIDAIIVVPGNSKAFAEGIKYLIDNPEQATLIGENGKTKCKKFFDPIVQGNKLLDFIENI